MHYVVTGANRGLGLEFVRQLLARGEHVTAGVREMEPASSQEIARLIEASAGRGKLFACDVASDASVKAFAAHLGEEPIDVLINNAGVYGKMQSLVGLDLDDVTRTFNVNALGPIRVTRALLKNVLASKTRHVVHITSGMGSISDNTSGGAYGYRMSKAALNMANRSMSIDYAAAGLIAVVMHPGWVKTDMGGKSAPLEVVDAVREMVKTIDAITPAQNGSFLNYKKGETYAY